MILQIEKILLSEISLHQFVIEKRIKEPWFFLGSLDRFVSTGLVTACKIHNRVLIASPFEIVWCAPLGVQCDAKECMWP